MWMLSYHWLQPPPSSNINILIVSPFIEYLHIPSRSRPLLNNLSTPAPEAGIARKSHAAAAICGSSSLCTCHQLNIQSGLMISFWLKGTGWLLKYWSISEVDVVLHCWSHCNSWDPTVGWASLRDWEAVSLVDKEGYCWWRSHEHWCGEAKATHQLASSWVGDHQQIPAVRINKCIYLCLSKAGCYPAFYVHKRRR